MAEKVYGTPWILLKNHMRNVNEIAFGNMLIEYPTGGIEWWWEPEDF